MPLTWVPGASPRGRRPCRSRHPSLVDPVPDPAGPPPGRVRLGPGDRLPGRCLPAAGDGHRCRRLGGTRGQCGVAGTDARTEPCPPSTGFPPRASRCRRLLPSRCPAPASQHRPSSTVTAAPAATGSTVPATDSRPPGGMATGDTAGPTAYRTSSDTGAAVPLSSPSPLKQCDVRRAARAVSVRAATPAVSACASHPGATPSGPVRSSPTNACGTGTPFEVTVAEKATSAPYSAEARAPPRSPAASPRRMRERARCPSPRGRRALRGRRRG